MNPFPEYARQFEQLIESALDRATQLSADCPARLRESMRYSLLGGGKRLRPLLALLSAHACSGDAERAMPAAVAMEMVHTYSLIHDDLPAMDDDDLRRGRPTNHRQFDESTAILAGDALLTLAFEVLASEIADPRLAIACCRELAQAAGGVGMVGGQQADLEAEKRAVRRHPVAVHSGGANASREAHAAEFSVESELHSLQEIHRRKTGRLITASVRMGAILGGASAAQLDAVTEYGNAIGLAFQITDDILDCTGTVEQMGKGVGKDAGRDKLTYPGLLGLEESRKQAEYQRETAFRALREFDGQADGLRAVAEYIISRNK